MTMVAATSQLAPRGTNASERLFEQYLDLQGLSFAYEPVVPGKRKRPDYHLRCKDDVIICDVKALFASSPRPVSGFYDPYHGIRKEIHEARRQFREYKDHPCVLVVHNVDDWEFRDWPHVIFGAMLGNLGLQFPFQSKTGTVQVRDAQHAFLHGGKMIDRRHGKPQNTTFSAVAVLGEITIPNPEFEREYERRVAVRRKTRRGKLSIEERLRIRMDLHEEQIPCVLGEQPRVAVFENPFARIPLPEDVFSGEFDARWRFNRAHGRIERVYAGRGLLKIELSDRKRGDILQKLERFKQSIVNRFKPSRIVLFGSHAYGCAEPGSDIDLLVVFPGHGSAVDRSLEIRKAVPTELPVDLLTRTEGEIAARLALNDPFFEDIMQRGHVLYESTGA